MKIKGTLLTCDFIEDTLTIQLPKGFWSKKRHVIRAGEVEIDTGDILPPRNGQCNDCKFKAIHL